jgi:ABC-type nitrate/sulfonate/bicarbonate transport system substrate-binding protein
MPRKTTLKVGGVPEHFNLPWHLAIESGAFSERGLNVVYKDYPGGTGALTRALQAKELDVAVVLTEGIVQAILRGNPSRIIKTYVQSPLIWGIHVPAKSGLQNVEDMQGKRYAISRFGSGSHLMAIVDTVQRGWEADQLNFVKIGNLTGARAAFAAGEADVFLWEKFMTKPYVDNGEFRRIGETTTPWPCFMIAARNERIRRSSKALKAMIEVISKTCSDLMKNKNAVPMIAERYGLQEEDVAVWFSKTKWNVANEPQPVELKKVIKSLLKAGIIEKEEAVEKVFTNIGKPEN